MRVILIIRLRVRKFVDGINKGLEIQVIRLARCDRKMSVFNSLSDWFNVVKWTAPITELDCKGN